MKNGNETSLKQGLRTPSARDTLQEPGQVLFSPWASDVSISIAGWAHQPPKAFSTLKRIILNIAALMMEEETQRLLASGPGCTFQELPVVCEYTMSALVPVGPTGRLGPMSVWSPESVGLITAHHLVCPLTWIHLLRLPIHQPAWAHPPRVPCLSGVCHSAHHTH